MDKKLNGFNNGRDTTEGVGGKTSFYNQVIADSQYFDDLSQILHSLKAGIDKDYIIKGLENTIDK